MKKEIKDRILDGAIYDVTGLDFLSVDAEPEDIEKHLQKTSIRKFIKKYPHYRIASAYNTDYSFLLSDEPKHLSSSKWNKENWFGIGFNYGSVNIIKNCPKDILILAEND